MFNKRTLWVVVGLSLALAIALVLSSCSSKKPDGPLPENSVPVVEIVNVPPSGSHFTTSPVINWFGTDADGFIVTYEYAVIKASVVAEAVDTGNPAAIIAYANSVIDAPGPTSPCDPTCWQIIDVANTDSPTRQEIRLIAGNTPADTVKQYFFVRGVDDDSARSITQYSLYSRNNNPPSTEITTEPDTTFYYDLPETTSVYRGVTFEWKGNDQIDFPNVADQPPFSYYYQVFGPYPHRQLDYDRTTGAPKEGFAIDTTDISKLVLSSRDANTGSVWVSNTDARFYNLWRGAPQADTTQIADFVVKVTARDDASAPDPTPEYKVFTAVYPKFEKNVLLFIPSFCFSSASPGEVPCFPNNYPIDYATYVENDMVKAYKKLFADAGYPDADTLHANFNMTESNAAFAVPSKQLYGKYRVVVILADGNRPKTYAIYFANLTDYMDFGGNVWLWSPSAFCGILPVSEGLLSIPAKSNQNYLANQWPIRYFGVSAEYRGFWNTSYTERALWDRADKENAPPTIEQHIGGLALQGTGFEDFDMDLEKVQLTYNYVRNGVDELDTLRFRGAPNSSYYVRDLLSEPLFLYESAFGSEIPLSYQRKVKQLQGTILAVRQNRGIFKSALFGFSAFCTKEDEAIRITQKMMDWFLD